MNRLFLRMACIAFVTAMALGCDTGNPLNLPPEGTPPTGTPPDGAPIVSIRGTVVAGGSTILTQVSLTGSGISRTAWSSVLDGTFIFVDLPPGVYIVTATPTGFACESATAEVEVGKTVTASIACAQLAPGTIAGTVTAGGTPIPGVVVHVVRGWTARGSAITDADGAFSLSVLTGGPYFVSASVSGTTCQSASVMVEENQTMSVNLVCEPTGEITGAVRWANGTPIPGQSLSLNGPSRPETQSFYGGVFTFAGLSPGDYTVGVTNGTRCPSVTATVEVAHVTQVVIVCELPDFREIQGEWFMYLPRENEDSGGLAYTQMGDCPPPLPAENGQRSTTYDPASGRFAIVDLDPDLTIVGDLQVSDWQPETGRWLNGTGSAVRPDGSSIRSEVIGSFHGGVGAHFSFWGSMTREHRDPAGVLVCTETYQVVGNKVL